MVYSLTLTQYLSAESSQLLASFSWCLDVNRLIELHGSAVGAVRLGLNDNEAPLVGVEIEGWDFSTMYLLALLIRARYWYLLLLFSDINDCSSIPST